MNQDSGPQVWGVFLLPGSCLSDREARLCFLSGGLPESLGLKQQPSSCWLSPGEEVGEWGGDAGSDGWGGVGGGQRPGKGLPDRAFQGTPFCSFCSRKRLSPFPAWGGDSKSSMLSRSLEGRHPGERSVPGISSPRPSPLPQAPLQKRFCLSIGLRTPGGLRVPHLGLVQHSPGLGNGFLLRPRKAEPELWGATAEPPYPQCLGKGLEEKDNFCAHAPEPSDSCPICPVEATAAFWKSHCRQWQQHFLPALC